MTSTTLSPKKSPSSNTRADRKGAKPRRDAGRSYVASRSAPLRGASPSEATARRQRSRAGMPGPIPLAKIHPSLRELPRLERETSLAPYVIADRGCRDAMHCVRS